MILSHLLGVIEFKIALNAQNAATPQIATVEKAE